MTRSCKNGLISCAGVSSLPVPTAPLVGPSLLVNIMAAKTHNPCIGETFGRWTVVGGVERKGRELYFLSRCVCGVEKQISKANPLSGRSKSCGCLSVELIKQRCTTHGQTRSALYAVWNMMKQRCTNPNNIQFSDYGGRGITVDPDWMKFENFYADMGDAPFPGASIERKDTNKGYSKANCVWADRQTQNSNTRKSVRFWVRGEELSIRELAEKYNINVQTLRSRLYIYGMSAEEAVTTPVRTAAEAAVLPKLDRPRAVGRIDGHKLYSPDATSQISNN